MLQLPSAPVVADRPKASSRSARNTVTNSSATGDPSERISVPTRVPAGGTLTSTVAGASTGCASLIVGPPGHQVSCG
jgi:hypothetical protein